MRAQRLVDVMAAVAAAIILMRDGAEVFLGTVVMAVLYGLIFGRDGLEVHGGWRYRRRSARRYRALRRDWNFAVEAAGVPGARLAGMEITEGEPQVMHVDGPGHSFRDLDIERLQSALALPGRWHVSCPDTDRPWEWRIDEILLYRG